MALSFETAREIVLQAEAFRRRAFEADCRAGLVEDHVAFRPLSEAGIDAEAARKVSADVAWKASPQRRVLAAIRELEGLGYPEAAKLRGYYDRDLSDARQPADVAAITSCIRILNDIRTDTAREGIDALLDMLGAQAPAQAA